MYTASSDGSINLVDQVSSLVLTILNNLYNMLHGWCVCVCYFCALINVNMQALFFNDLVGEVTLTVVEIRRSL